MIGAEARLRDLEAAATTSEPSVMVMRRYVSLDDEGAAVTRSPWSTLVTLEATAVQGELT